jgi:hypothetical protein
MQKVIDRAVRQERCPGRLGEQGGQVNRPGYVMEHKVEIWVNKEVPDIFFPPRDEIVKADDLMALGEQTVAKMGP